MADDLPTYSIDTSSLVVCWIELYPPEIFPPVWERLQRLMHERPV